MDGNGVVIEETHERLKIDEVGLEGFGEEQ